ncbi:ethanolamine ammonia-lyase light chain EutC, partial [Escherichia coli]|uniref:ethanolamine ammonia-lyase light chain EutC n=2 Tax=Pseudomonadota TaxID=1224 RepID=UPI0022F13AE0
AALAQAGFASLVVHSAAADRAQYLCRPDLGRRLSDASRASLAAARPAKPVDTVFVIADGLSALAAVNHGALLLHSVRERLPAEW